MDKQDDHRVSLPSTRFSIDPAPSAQPGGTTGRSLGQILIVLLVALVLVNIPIRYGGTGLAQSMPRSTPVIIYDGVLLKGSGPEIYIVEDHKLRWIGSPEAFGYYFRQHDVYVVEDSLLESFGKGQSIHRLVTCPNSPHIYALENGQKRWVKDPPTGNQARAWDKVGLVSCDYLRSLPDGSPIPEDTAIYR